MGSREQNGKEKRKNRMGEKRRVVGSTVMRHCSTDHSGLPGGVIGYKNTARTREAVLQGYVT